MACSSQLSCELSMSYQPDDQGGILKEICGHTGLTHFIRVCMDRVRPHSRSRRACINFTENRVNSVPPVVYFRNALWINLSAAIR